MSKIGERVISRADERVEARWQIAHRRQAFGAGRIAGIVMLGLIALLLPVVGPNRFIVAGILIGLVAPMSFVIERFVPHPRTDSAHVALDLATAIGLSQIVPEAWFVAVVLGIASLSSSITSLPIGLFFALHALFLVGMAATAIAHDVDGWGLPIVALAGTTMPIVMYGRWFRKNEEIVSSRVGDLMESTVAIFWEADRHGLLTAAWGRVFELTGYTPDEWMERFPGQVVHPDDLHLVQLTPNERHLESVEHTLRVQHRDGHWLWIRHLIRFDRRGRNARLMGVSFDVTTLERTRASLRKQAHRDALTSLPNRAAILESLETRLREDHTTGILLLDLNGFKIINDTLGHPTGDHLLSVVGSRLAASVGPEAMVGRLGGDEFAILLTGDVTEAELLRLAHRVAATVASPVTLSGVELTTSASIGVSLAPRHGTTTDQLIRKADIAMYEAKRTQTTVQMFDGKPETLSLDRLALSTDLGQHLTRRLELWYQPIVDLGTGETTGYEGLARWRDPQRGIIMPSEFLELVHATGLNRRLDRQVLALAAQAAGQLGAPRIRVSVNLSARSLGDRPLRRRLDQLLDTHGLDPSSLCLEINERDIDADVHQVEPMLLELADAGFVLALDDFGSGYSSLGRLTRLPVSEVKLDRSFALALEESNRAQTVVSSILTMIAEMGLVSVAEGIESERMARLFRELGCQRAQGYHFGRPAPLTTVVPGARVFHAPATDPLSASGRATSPG